MKRSFLTLLLACFCILAGAQEADGTYFFAQRDTCNLFMDVYNPSRQSERTFQGKAKPTIPSATKIRMKWRRLNNELYTL